MSLDQPPPARSTSLWLIALTLITGVALGWLLRDLLGPAAPLTPPPAATVLPTRAADRPTVPPSPAATLAPSAAPTLAPATATLPSEPTDTPAPPTLAPTAPQAEPSAEPTAAPAIEGYLGHQVAPGETLESIAAAAGSTPDLIARYNLLDGEPPAGRALIIPRAAGRPSELGSAPLLVQKGPARKPWVALTLDAGASAEPVPGMLAALRAHNVKLTFFLTGKWIKENPELTRQIVADGHEIANHTFSHPDMRNLSDAAIAQELADTEVQLAEAAPGASARPFFRPPFGAYDERVLLLTEAQGYLPIYWTFDSLDSVGEPKSAAFLLDRITNHLPPDQLPGAIILAHCGSQPTADALPAILDRFAELGIEVKKLSEVLQE